MSILENLTMIMEAAPRAHRHRFRHHLARHINTAFLPLFPRKPIPFLGSLPRYPLPIHTMVRHRKQ